MKNKFIIAVLGIAVMSSCKDNTTKTTKEEPRGIILANMDTTVSPKTNFYDYVNGTWMKNTQIPDDRSSWGGFSVLRKSTDDNVLNIIAKAKETNKYAADTDQAKALFLFDSKLDTASRNQMGISPLQPTLDAISNLSSLAGLQSLLVTDPAVSSPFMSLALLPT